MQYIRGVRGRNISFQQRFRLELSRFLKAEYHCPKQDKYVIHIKFENVFKIKNICTKPVYLNLL